jgi:hypothetical protein
LIPNQGSKNKSKEELPGLRAFSNALHGAACTISNTMKVVDPIEKK